MNYMELDVHFPKMALKFTHSFTHSPVTGGFSCKGYKFRKHLRVSDVMIVKVKRVVERLLTQEMVIMGFMTI